MRRGSSADWTGGSREARGGWREFLIIPCSPQLHHFPALWPSSRAPLASATLASCPLPSGRVQPMESVSRGLEGGRWERSGCLSLRLLPSVVLLLQDSGSQSGHHASSTCITQELVRRASSWTYSNPAFWWTQQSAF